MNWPMLSIKVVLVSSMNCSEVSNSSSPGVFRIELCFTSDFSEDVSETVFHFNRAESLFVLCELLKVDVDNADYIFERWFVGDQSVQCLVPVVVDVVYFFTGYPVLEV